MKIRAAGVLVASVALTVSTGAGTALASTSVPTSAEVLTHDLDMTPAQATTALGQLDLKAPHSMSGYSDESFPHWLDASKWGWPLEPSNACDAREAALYRDGTDVTYESDTCTITGGSWVDPYTGDTFTSPHDMDIDHFVPRAEAWRAGADDWTDTQRRAFANAPLELVTVSASPNRSKGDKTPDAWKPPNTEAYCLYAVRWIDVETTYDLFLTSTAEKSALNSMLETC